MLLSETNYSLNIKTIKQLAYEAHPTNKVLADLTVAQAIHESNLTGKPSKLALLYCNLFGMKPSRTIKENKLGTKGVINMPTMECNTKGCHKINQPFLYNKSIKDSIEQHKRLLNRPRYAKVVNSKSFKEAAYEVVKAQYATDPQYATKLINIYNRYIRTGE